MVAPEVVDTRAMFLTVLSSFQDVKVKPQGLLGRSREVLEEARLGAIGDYDRNGNYILRYGQSLSTIHIFAQWAPLLFIGVPGLLKDFCFY
jgi:hypothetical protein